MKAFNVILGFFAFLASFYGMMFPGLTFLSTGWIVAILLGVWGICAVVNFFIERKNGKKQGTDTTTLGVLGLILGLLSAVLSVLMLIKVGPRIAVDLIAAGAFLAWMVIGGIRDIIVSIVYRKTTPLWGLTLVLGIFMLLGGIFGFGHLLFTMQVAGMLMASVFMLYGFRLMASAFEKEPEKEK